MSNVSFEFPYPDAIVSICVSYEMVRKEELVNCNHEVNEWDCRDNVEDNPAISEMMQIAEARSQQPAVPIQFVYLVDKGDLYSVDESPNIAGCTVEQIGAVLYVRGKEKCSK